MSLPARTRPAQAAAPGPAKSPVPQAPLVVVIDTNIVLDLFVFDDPATRPLRAALQTGTVRWLATDAMRAELARVLNYPHIAPRLASLAAPQPTAPDPLPESAPGKRCATAPSSTHITANSAPSAPPPFTASPFSPPTAQDVLAAFDRHAQLLPAAAQAPVRCTDADDQAFINLAAAHRATLLSKDRAVLRLKKRLAALGVAVCCKQPADSPSAMSPPSHVPNPFGTAWAVYFGVFFIIF